jgi:hypothetical protein
MKFDTYKETIIMKKKFYKIFWLFFEIMNFRLNDT